MLSKFLSRNFLKNCLKTCPNQKQFFIQTSLKAFSTTRIEQAERLKSSLSKALAREINYENDNYQTDETIQVIQSRRSLLSFRTF